MSLITQLNSLATRIGTEFKAVKAREGALTALSTTDKSTLVAAINEVNSKPSGTGGAAINDSAPSTTTTYSSSKTDSQLALKANLASPAFTGTPTGITKTHVGLSSVDNTADAAKPVSTAQAAAINAKPSINDTTPSASTTYSGTKIDSSIAAATAALVNSSPAALDTLKELSDALGGDASFAATTATALGNRLKVDAAQTLTTAQQAFGRSNLNVYSTTEIGNPETNFVTVFEAAIA